VRRLERVAQRRLDWFLVVERSAGFAHVHALISGADDLALNRLQRAWKLGFTRVERYDPQRGAAFYLTKGFDDSGRPESGRTDDYDLSRCLRRVSRESGGRAESLGRTLGAGRRAG
jgi:hypothetical protein